MIKLINRKNNWYLMDSSVQNVQDGSAVIYADSTPAFANFIDQEEKTCFLSNGIGEVSFDEFEIIIASTNASDGTPMINLEMIEDLLLENFIFDTILDTVDSGFGVNYPDEHDSVLGYFSTEKEAIAALRKWFSTKPFPILVRDMYYARYTSHFENDVMKPYIVDGFINIFKVTIKDK